MSGFRSLVDLAADRLGGKALAANDEFFAPKENLLKAGPAVFIAGKYTARGKWMDGWETRRRRVPGHDWCVVKLALRGTVRGAVVDTAHFIGNYPEACSLEAVDLPKASPARLAAAAWTELVPRSALKGGSENLFPIEDDGAWTHVRLNIFPDGGVARLRLHGEVVPDFSRLKAGARLDLAAVENGGRVLEASDMHFGAKDNILLPGRALNMGDGWETRRRRGPGNDWCVVRLGAAGILDSIEVHTTHFKGNYPESCRVEASDGPDGPWRELIARTKLGPDRAHRFPLKGGPRATHLRLSIYPDGGVARLRVHGRLAQA